jgi:predicted Zn-dependent protease
LEAAVQELNEAVRRDPSLGSAYYQLARVYAKLGEKEKSESALAEFHKLYQEQANDSPEVADDARRETQSPEIP